MKEKKHIISRVLPGSIAQELELAPGDILLSVNGREVEDIFDYRYLTEDELVTLLIRKPDGEEWELEVEKDYGEDLGLEFENGLMDEYRSCSNRCIFCFIDQMPPGMRDTLYFKDDDSRLSFLQGNYVTLTNMSRHDIDRIIHYHLSPINISFHTMNPDLRCRMLHNRFAGEALKKVDLLYEAGTAMNGQIVLCKGINDGEELEYSLSRLAQYIPCLESVSVVPVGLTKYRKELYPLQAFNKEDAEEVLSRIHRWQEKMQKEHGTHFVHASDEWYILAQQELPEEERYDGYPQLENGVGMLRLLDTEVKEALERRKGDHKVRKATAATGKLAAPFLERHMERIREKYPETDVQVTAVENEFFGSSITVSGLITGRDLLKSLSGKDLGDKLLIPCNMLRSGEDVFLDDMTLEELSEKLGIRITVAGETGEDLVEAVLGAPGERNDKRRQMYEQTSSSHSGEAECREIHSV